MSEGEGVLEGPALLVRVLTAEEDLVVTYQVVETDVKVIGSRRQLGYVSDGGAAPCVRIVGLDDHFGEEGESKPGVHGDGKGGTDRGEERKISRPPSRARLPDEKGRLAGEGVGGSRV